MSDSLQPHGFVVHQAPLSMEFSRQEYWNRLPFPSPTLAAEQNYEGRYFYKNENKIEMPGKQTRCQMGIAGDGNQVSVFESSSDNAKVRPD